MSARDLCLGVLAAWLVWACGANCLRDSDCEGGLVCSRDSCVLPSRRSGDAGVEEEGSAGASAAGAAGNAGSSAIGAAGGAGGGSSGGGASSGGVSGSSAGNGSAGSSGESAAGGGATGGRENLDASADADAASSRS